MRKTLVVVSLTTVLAAACGTTVPQTTLTRGALSSGTGQGAAVPTSGAQPADGGGGLAAPAGDRPTQGSAGTAAANPLTASPAPVAPGAQVTMGRGVTSTTITLGISVLAGGSTNTALTAAGASEAAVGDGKAAAQAVITYLNAHGGIAGRRIVPVYREWDTTQDWQPEYQRDCSTFIEDNTVFGVVSQVDQPGWNLLASCLAAHHIPFLHNSRLLVEQSTLQGWAPYVYETSTVGAEHWGALVDAWFAGGFFDKGAKVGVVLWDDGVAKRVLAQTVAPRLAAHGLQVDATAAVPPYYSSTTIGPTASQYQNAVLKFSQLGITHVLFLGTWSTGPFFFLKAAENQGYRPRYGLNSTELPNFIVQSDPAAQLHRAVDVAFWPSTDVPANHDPNDNAAQALCLKVIKDAGIAAPSRFAAMEYLRTCDGLFFLRQALSTTTDLTTRGLRAAADRLGSQYQSPLTFATAFGPQRYDGVGSLRLADFDDASGSFVYRRASSFSLDH